MAAVLDVEHLGKQLEAIVKNTHRQQVREEALSKLDLTPEEAREAERQLNLSEAEGRVLEVACAFPDLSAKEVANKLGVKDSTVENQWKAIYNKLSEKGVPSGKASAIVAFIKVAEQVKVKRRGRHGETPEESGPAPGPSTLVERSGFDPARTLGKYFSRMLERNLRRLWVAALILIAAAAVPSALGLLDSAPGADGRPSTESEELSVPSHPAVSKGARGDVAQLSLGDRVAVTAEGDGLSLYSFPSTGAPTVGPERGIAAGYEGFILSGPLQTDEGAWVEVSWVTGKTGWSLMKSPDASPPTQPLPGVGVFPNVRGDNRAHDVLVYGDVGPAGLAVRERPGSHHPIKMRVHSGEEVRTVGSPVVVRDGDTVWWELEIDGEVIGWVEDSSLASPAGVYLLPLRASEEEGSP